MAGLPRKDKLTLDEGSESDDCSYGLTLGLKRPIVTVS